MIFKVELTKENVENAMNFFIANTVFASMADGKGIFNLVVHETMETIAENICLELNAARNDIAIRKTTYSWSYEEIAEEVKYGWFLYAE